MAAVDALFKYRPPADADEARNAALLKKAIEDFSRARLLVGSAPPTPPTFRGRVGALLVDVVRRSLFWLFPQLDQLHQAMIRVAEEQCRTALAKAQGSTLEAEQRTDARVTALRSEIERQFAGFHAALDQLREDLRAERDVLEHHTRKIVITTIAGEVNHMENRRAKLESATWLEAIKCRTELERIATQLAALKQNQIPSDSACASR